jgi:hypothetical protein
MVRVPAQARPLPRLEAIAPAAMTVIASAVGSNDLGAKTQIQTQNVVDVNLDVAVDIDIHAYSETPVDTQLDTLFAGG